MDLIGALSSAAGAGGAAEPAYIEDVFSTYLYTGNGSTQTITNGIDLDGEGGLVWTKKRNVVLNHYLFDTERSALNAIYTSSTLAQEVKANTLTAFNADGFSIGTSGFVNENAQAYASWTFRKAPKFFDVVTYTGTGSARTVSHNLGSVPGCIMVKRTDTTGDWQVYHRANTANPETDYLVLNSTTATVDSNTRWNDTLPTDSVFTVGTEATVNASGGTYVAYIFAHDAGGFGDDGEQNVISCGSYTGAGNGTYVTTTLGWEPQWLMIKRTDLTQDWLMLDVMRGLIVREPYTSDNDAGLYANTSGAEALNPWGVSPTATGFRTEGNNISASGGTYIYIAIRRGPMKTPTSGTEVFAVDNGNSSDIPAFNSGFPVDMGMTRSTSISTMYLSARLTQGRALVPQSTASETTLAKSQFDYMSGWINQAEGSTDYGWMFRRAPGFFDVVCYTGTGVARTVDHNLDVVPEMMIVKHRDSSTDWVVYHAGISALPERVFIRLQTNEAVSTSSTAWWNYTLPTASVFTVGTNSRVNESTKTYVAYLFATLAGVSKVGSYTGTGTTLQVDCGFSAGARFVMIKRTDSTGDWYVWDSARGIIAGNDPFILINSTAAENTSTDYIDPLSSGFEISSTAPAAINASGGNFIFLAIA